MVEVFKFGQMRVIHYVSMGENLSRNSYKESRRVIYNVKRERANASRSSGPHRLCAIYRLVYAIVTLTLRNGQDYR